MTGRPYGRVRRGAKTTRKAKTIERIGRLTVRLRGRDDMPFSMAQMKQALFQLIHELEPHSLVRVKNVALCLTTVDQNGQEVCLNGKAIWNIFPTGPRPTTWTGAAGRYRIRFPPRAERSDPPPDPVSRTADQPRFL